MPQPITRKQAVDRLLAGRSSTAQGTGSAFAPANIALCKYWGKRNIELNLPVTSSLSVSLGTLGTTTTITPADRDRVVLNGSAVPEESLFAQRLFNFIDLMRPPGTPVEVMTENTVPTAAGLASSASGFAACVRALDALFQWNLSGKDLSILARMGSGSASRSVYDGFVQWHAGTEDDGSDSFAECLPHNWPELCIGLCVLEAGPKPMPSTQGMINTVEKSVLYRSWPDQVAADLPQLIRALETQSFTHLGETAERNALAMHATMIASTPPLIYWTPETVQTIHTVHKLRDQGLDIYLTMDAGPNVKLLFQKQDEDAVLKQFPDLTVVKPFSN